VRTFAAARTFDCRHRPHPATHAPEGLRAKCPGSTRRPSRRRDRPMSHQALDEMRGSKLASIDCDFVRWVPLRPGLDRPPYATQLLILVQSAADECHRVEPPPQPLRSLLPAKFSRSRNPIGQAQQFPDHRERSLHVHTTCGALRECCCPAHLQLGP